MPDLLTKGRTVEILRTPDGRFADLPGYDFGPNYLEIPFEGQRLRMHYVDEGARASADQETVLLVHGEPSWSYLYRRMIPVLLAAGHRVVAPDLIGFGRSDKPARITDYTYDRQVAWLRAGMFEILGLRDVTLFCQDWGGLLSLRLVAFEPDLFARVMVANTGLPVGGPDSNFVPGDGPRLRAASVFATMWQGFARRSPVFPVGRLAQQLASESRLTKAEMAAYDAPFPSDRYKAGPRAMPQLIPTRPDSPDSVTNREAWRRLADFDRPFRTGFGAQEPTLRFVAVDEHFQRHVKGATGQRHERFPSAGHYLQEDAGERVAASLNEFIATNPR